MTLSNKFIERLSNNFQGYQLTNEEYLLKIANYLASISPVDYQLEDKPFAESVIINEELLSKINPDYLALFKQMLIEQNQDNPVIYVYSSGSKDNNRNESFTYANEMHIYKTDNISDVFLLLHEFTHFLINREKSYTDDKINNEIAPILIEFIIANHLNDYNYLKQRLNYLIHDAKSLLIKKSIIGGNYNLEELYSKYAYSPEEIKEFEEDLLYSKSLKYEEERNYLYGFLNAYYFSLSNSIENYQELVNRLTKNRNIPFPELPLTILEDLYQQLSNTNNKNL